MRVIEIKKGRNLPFKGASDGPTQIAAVPAEVRLSFAEFRARQFRVLVNEGDRVLVGTPVAADRDDPRIILVSSASGVVRSVLRGDKRSLLAVVITTDGKQEALRHRAYSPDELASLGRDQLAAHLMQTGVWILLRQRPFSRTANPAVTPKAVFVRAMNTDPLAPSLDRIMEGRDADVQTGLEVLRKLTPGKVYLCLSPDSRCAALTEAKNVEVVGFKGPHPAGNVGTHIHALDPIGKGDAVWYIEAEDVARLGSLFKTGSYDPVKTVAVTGEGAAVRGYFRTVQGATPSVLLGGTAQASLRYISGSVLNGHETGFDGGLGYFHNQLTVLPAGGSRSFLGWLSPRLDRFSFSRAVPSSFCGSSEYSVDTDFNGSIRAVVVNDVYDDLVAIDVMTYFLIRAIHAGQIEEMIRLGILECAPEDFALATFACPSKVDVGAVIQRGLDQMEKEG